MRRHIHLDAVGGVAGDMFCAALLDAFPELLERVTRDVVAVLPGLAGRNLVSEVKSAGLRSLRFGGALAEVPDPWREASGRGTHHPPGTGYVDLVRRLDAAALSAGTGENAKAVLKILAAAEARVHGVAMEDVHFHEIADWDSLMDVVAAGSIAAALTGARWTIFDLPQGGGLVSTAHGRLPVPAPATAAILEGFRFRDDGVSGERVTPTGAAIIRHLVSPADLRPASGRLDASGTGAGTRTLFGIPNILRALVYDLDDTAAEGAAEDEVMIISFDVDDMTGEEIAVAADHLRAATGVLDVAVSVASGKKGRIMHCYRVLLRPEHAPEIEAACFSETSTIGLRRRRETRALLARTGSIAGNIRRKHVTRPGDSQTVKAENDDLAAVSGLAERRRLRRRAEDLTR